MLKKLVFCSILCSVPCSMALPVERIEVRLTSSSVNSYRGWLIVFEDGEEFTFDKDGAIDITPPDDERSVIKILDTAGGVRFYGQWENQLSGTLASIPVSDRAILVEMTVSANRIEQPTWEVPNEITVISREKQPEKSIPQTSDMLKEQAEVLLQKTNLGGGSPIMRGMSGNRVLLMVDGFRINNTTFRLGLNQYLNTVPSGQLAQMEVMSGPSGVQYGSDGLGGTIHLRSNDPTVIGQEPQLTYSGFGSSADGTNTHQLQGSFGSGDLFVSGHFRYNNYADLEAGGDVGEQPATGFDSWDGSANMTWQLNNDETLRLINNVSDAREVPRTDRIASGRDLLWDYDPQIFRLHGLRYERTFHNASIDFMDVGLGYMYAEEGNRRISASSPDELTETLTEVDTLQLNGTFTKVTDKVMWVFGFDSQQDDVGAAGFEQDLRTGTTVNTPGKFPDGSDFRTIGLFLSPIVHLTDRQDLRLGLRQTFANLRGRLDQPIGDVDQDYEQLTPSITWSYNTGSHFFSLGASQGFRAPTLEDALSLGPSNQGFDAPNPDLEPEQLWSYESTYRYRTPASMFQITGYFGVYEDLMAKVRGTYQGEDTYEGEPVFILDNVGEAEIYGASMQYTRELMPHHSIEMDTSYVYGQQTDVEEPMRRIPPLRGNLSYAYHRKMWRLVSVFSWADRQDRLSPGDLDDSRIPADGTPGYGVWHLRGQYRINDTVGIKLGVENLFDKLYKMHGSGIYEPGRRVVLEVTASLR